jgi:hypothetical protein
MAFRHLSAGDGWELMVAALSPLSGDVKTRSPSPQRERRAWLQPKKHVYRKSGIQEPVAAAGRLRRPPQNRSIRQPASVKSTEVSDRSAQDRSKAEPDEVVQSAVARLSGRAASRATHAYAVRAAEIVMTR